MTGGVGSLLRQRVSSIGRRGVSLVIARAAWDLSSTRLTKGSRP